MNVRQRLQTGDEYSIKLGVEYLGSEKDKESSFVYEHDKKMYGLDLILQQEGFESVLNQQNMGEKRLYVKMMEPQGRQLSIDTYLKEDAITGDNKKAMYDIRGLSKDVDSFMQVLTQYQK